MPPPIKYVKSADGVRLAWQRAGTGGSSLVKAANWLTHLELDWESPVWRHWIQFFSEHFAFVRYDERGCGMTDWDAGDLSFPRWVEDLELVVEASGPSAPFALLGISQGAATAIEYSVRHPEQVSKLILYGGYSRGWSNRADEEGHRRYRAIVELARLGWGSDNPVFRNLFTSRFVPGAGAEELRWFSDLCTRTTRPDVAAKLLEARAEIDVVDQLGMVSVPTLVVHSRADEVVPMEEGRFLASEIPGAEFVSLDSKNHVLLESEPAWSEFQETVLRFCDVGVARTRASEAPEFATLSARERAILASLTAGRTNAELAREFCITEKTVRNHLTHVFRKLGVTTRVQAIVLARDGGFRA